jgi:hypothetical protein
MYGTMSKPACQPCKKTPKRFTLTETIKARKALRFAAKYVKLPFRQRMTLAKAEKAINATFGLN